MFKTIRNNPKKTVFFSALLGYGGYYSNDKFKKYQYRRKVCNAAKFGGDEPIRPTDELARVTVVYNPVANNRKSSTNFKKDVFPLLNLSGYKVTLAETERPEEGKELMSVLKSNDQECICVAGGDGTLMEVVTGLLRREDLRGQMKDIPLVIVPLGFHNSFAKRNNFIKLDDEIGTYDEAIKLIKKGKSKAFNVIKLRINREETEDSPETKPKEIFAVSGLDWSLDRDVMKIAKGKWVFGPFRYHWQYFLSAVFGKNTKENKSATLTYINDCTGCSKCVSVTPQITANRGWWFTIKCFLLPMIYKQKVADEKAKSLEQVEKSKITNADCGAVFEKHLADVRGLSVVLEKDQLRVRVKRSEPHFVQYIRSGVSRISDIPYGDGGGEGGSDAEVQDDFICSQLRIVPEQSTEGQHYYIDNEQVDVVPLDIRVLRDAVFIYSP